MKWPLPSEEIASLTKLSKSLIKDKTASLESSHLSESNLNTSSLIPVWEDKKEEIMKKYLFEIKNNKNVKTISRNELNVYLNIIKKLLKRKVQ